MAWWRSRKVLLSAGLVCVLLIVGQSSRFFLPVSSYSIPVPSQVENRPYSKEPTKNKNILGMLEAKRLQDNYTHCNRIKSFQGPYNYLKESKNPCWRHKEGNISCIPYFYLPGFSKSGTSDVFSKIKAHPQVTGKTKERHYFDFLLFKDKRHIYKDWFTEEAKAINKELAVKGSSDTIVGDGTPCYAFFSLKWRCLEGNEGREEPLYTVADHIHHLYPKSKLIFIMREPASRLYSRFLTWVNVLEYEAYMNASPQSFHGLVSRAIEKYTECFQRWSPRHCAYNGTLYQETTLRLQEGMYSVFLKDWLKIFPREQVLIIRFEDYIKDTEAYVPMLYSFLGLDKLKEERITELSERRPVNKGKHYDIGKMLPETRKLLEEFYAPFVRELANLLEDRRFLWHYGAGVKKKK